MNGFNAFTFSPAGGEQEMAATWEAAYGSTPWGGYAALQGVSMITTFNGTDEEVVTTPALQQTQELLLRGGRHDWAQRLLAVNGYAPDKTGKLTELTA